MKATNRKLVLKLWSGIWTESILLSQMGGGDQENLTRFSGQHLWPYILNLCIYMYVLDLLIYIVLVHILDL